LFEKQWILRNIADYVGVACLSIQSTYVLVCSAALAGL
jgi:hypothetical protein